MPTPYGKITTSEDLSRVPVEPAEQDEIAADIAADMAVDIAKDSK